MTGKRFRDLGLSIGRYPVGKWNAITDVRGVRVGQVTINMDSPRSVHTGLTLILPKSTWEDYSAVGYYLLNGNGDTAGLEVIDEYGQICTPIALTNTLQVGLVRDALVRYYREHISGEAYEFPLVAETDDSWLSDNSDYPLSAGHVFQALDSASEGPVEEGNVGGGTGMICFDFKGGIGTSSRLVKIFKKTYTIGVLVQTNFGSREDLNISGVPVGKVLGYDVVPGPGRSQSHPGSSIVVVVATDAPLLPGQCKRIAQRVPLALGRLGSKGQDESGDLIVAFASGDLYPSVPLGLVSSKIVPHEALDCLFEAAIEATEEAVINSLTAASSIVGRNGHKVEAIPLDLLRDVLHSHLSSAKT